MKVEPISNGNIRIWLSQQEMDAADAADLRRALRQVLTIAQGRLARMGGRIVADMIPVEGGCVLLLSARRRKANAGPLVCYIDTLRDVFQLAERLTVHVQSESYPQACLYAVDGGYALVIYPSPHLTRQQARAVRELGCPLDKGETAAAVVAEHGRALAIGDALKRLSFTAHELDRPAPSDRES